MFNKEQLITDEFGSDLEEKTLKASMTEQIDPNAYL